MRNNAGDIIQLSLQGKEYDPDLVFKVPCDHPEIVRLQGRCKSCAPRYSLKGRSRAETPAKNSRLGT